jgi:hypothetical protein
MASTRCGAGAIDLGYNALTNIVINNERNPAKLITRLDDTSPDLASDNIRWKKLLFLFIAILKFDNN